MMGGKINTTAYKDSHGIPTIGIGFNLAADRNKTNSLLASFGYSKAQIANIVNGKQAITPQQAKSISTGAIIQHMGRARRLVKNFDTLPPAVQDAVISAVYRTDLGPKAAALMNAGKWAQASRQYLNNDEYKQAASNKKYPQQRGSDGRGVAGRMQRNAKAFQDYARTLIHK